MDKNLLNTIQQLEKENNKLKIIRILQKYLDNKDTNETMDIGWAYWNISDNYAMLRMCDEEYENHKKFSYFASKELPKTMLFWPVSDGTQKLTLIKGGYGEFWYDLYLKACNNAPRANENLGIRFESHRAAISLIGPLYEEPNLDISEFALNNMKELINENLNDYNIGFYKITYYSLLLIVNTYLKRPQSDMLDKALETFNTLVPYLDKEYEREEYNHILGTWNQLNSKRPLYSQAKVGINNFILNLIDISQYKVALECYKVFEEKRIPVYEYFKNRIEYAKSNS